MTDYEGMARQIRALAEEDSWFIPLLSNASALLYSAMDRLNWAGFYLLRDGRLTLGPFQGKVACVHIARGRGVCGTALERGETIRVDDVHAFPGHIACDSASNSEIVLPLIKDGTVFGVLDIDSPVFSRFSEADAAGLETVARAIGEVVTLE